MCASFAVTTTMSSAVRMFWAFDNNTLDLYNTYNGIGVNSPTFVTGYTGLNSRALKANTVPAQYVVVSTPYFNFTYRSFTVELWFYPLALTASDFGFFGQCQSVSTRRCLIYMIRNFRLLLAFYGGKYNPL